MFYRITTAVVPLAVSRDQRIVRPANPGVKHLCLVMGQG